MLELRLYQDSLTQFQVFVFFVHATFSHEEMLHLELERADNIFLKNKRLFTYLSCLHLGSQA